MKNMAFRLVLTGVILLVCATELTALTDEEIATLEPIRVKIRARSIQLYHGDIQLPKVRYGQLESIINAIDDEEASRLIASSRKLYWPASLTHQVCLVTAIIAGSEGTENWDAFARFDFKSDAYKTAFIVGSAGLIITQFFTKRALNNKFRAIERYNQVLRERFDVCLNFAPASQKLALTAKF